MASNIAKIYQKKNLHEHILARPDSYIGSIKNVVEEMYVIEEDSNQIIKKKIQYVPGLLKIFDEILVNAIDQSVREPETKVIKVSIKNNAEISVKNDGPGVPVVLHPEYKIYVPELIFGNLLTGSNYDDTEQRIVGGLNGYGGKVSNIYSKAFTVETVDSVRKLKYVQHFKNNMFEKSEPKVTSTNEKSYTKITFTPDYSRFGLTELTPDLISVLKRRTFDTAGTSKVKVYFNDVLVPVKDFQSYIRLYSDVKEPLIYEKETQGKFEWEYAVSLTESYSHSTFVNGISTNLGGRHLEYVSGQIVKKLTDIIESKKKITVKPSYIKERLFFFVRATVINPSFSSQSKDTLTTPAKDFGIKFDVSDAFISKLYKSGIVEDIVSFTNYKNQKVLEKNTDGKKKNKITGIPKLEDANFAGTSKSEMCRLILTEGDSAKTFAISGLSVIGRDKYGIFPMRGAVLNVREATVKQLASNEEIANIKKILGLQQTKTYTDTKSLRYGGIIILTDADSVTYDTPVLLKDNTTGEVLTKPICEAYDYEDWAIEPFSGKEYNSCSKYKIWSDDGWTDIKHVMRHKVDKPIFRVNTSKGCVDVTKDHSLLDYQSKSITVDDCVVGETKLLHSKYIQETVFDYGINEEYAYGLGYFMADGFCSTDCKTSFVKEDGTFRVNNKWQITCTSHLTLLILKKIFEKYDGTDLVKFNIRKIMRKHHVSFSNKNYIYNLDCKGMRKDFCDKMRKMFYNSLREKQVPKEILNSSVLIQQAFLEGFYQGNGDKSRTGNQTRGFDIQHKTSILGMFQLLQNCGYSPNVLASKRKLNVYTVLMSKKNCRPVHTVKSIIDVSEKYKNTYVYDFETENHHFHASTGNIIVKNCDGIHLQGLVMNFIHTWWPELLEMKGFITKMKTPIIKASKGKDSKEFYTIKDYKDWEKSINSNSWNVKYFKGLGTSTAAEAKGLFSRLQVNTINYTSNSEKETNDIMLLAFEKKQADARKAWLGTYNKDFTLDQADTDVSYTDFVNKDLIHFSMYDNIRSIPSICDGLKPSQRKILYTLFSKNYKNEIKVAQLGSAVAEFSNYHHGEMSLVGAIVNMAQDYIGSNNLNLLKPNGQFGTRILGGNDAASPRYIFTELSSITSKLFLKEDRDILPERYEEGSKIEPEFYIPIIPLILVNGAIGIGTGYSTNVPGFNPVDIISNMIRVAKKLPQVEMVPWYSGFKGKITKTEPGSFNVSGIYTRTGNNSITITELPVGIWTSDYKEYLEKLESDPVFGITNIVNNSSEVEVNFKIVFSSEDFRRKFFEADAEKILKMNKNVSTKNMHLFDENGSIKKYNSAEEIIQEFTEIRLRYNQKRKDALLAGYISSLSVVDNKIRFLTEIIEGTFVVYRRSKKDITDELAAKEYFKYQGNYDYLTSLPIYSFTTEKIEELEEKSKNLKKQITDLEGKTILRLLSDDLKSLKN